MPQRRLVLKRENLSELGPDDMRAVVGATHIPTDCGCVTHGYSCEACPVPTVPLNTCGCTVTIPAKVCLLELTDTCF